MDDSALVARAAKERDRGELRTAMLDLKNALQKNPANTEARLALGELSFQTGDVETSIAELERAREQGASAERVAAPLARAYLSRGRAEEALKLLDGLEGTQSAELQTLKGSALLALARPAEARDQFERVLQGDANSAEALFGLTRAVADLEGIPAALAMSERALRAAPKDARVRILRGELQLRAHAPALALEEFERAARDAEESKQPAQRLSALAGQAEAVLAQSLVAESLAVTQQMEQIAPDNALTRYMRARALVLAGKGEEARPLLEKNVSQNAAADESKLLLGIISLSEGYFGQAEMYLSSVVTAQPDNLRARRLLAEARLRERKPTEALQALLPAATGEAPNPQILAAAGKVSLAAGQTKAGLEYLERSVKAEPGNSATRLDLVAAYLSTGQVDRASALLDSAPADAKSVSHYRYLKTLTFMARNDKAGAVDFVTATAKKNPVDPDAQVLAGSFLAAQKQFDRARPYFERAAELRPDAPSAYVNLGRLELAQARLEPARAQFALALERAPADPAASLAMAQLELGRQQPAAALAVLTTVLKAHPAFTEAQVLAGDVLFKQKKYSDAAAAYHKAGALNPGTSVAVREFQALRLGGLSDPLEPLRRLLEQRPNDAGARLALAQAQQETGDASAAARTYETILARDPNHAAALNNLAWLQYESGNSGAVSLAKRAHAAAPNDPRITDTYAWLLVESGQVKEGVTLLAPIAGAGADAEVRMHYARALAKAGKREEARALGATLVASSSAKVSEEARRLVAELDGG